MVVGLPVVVAELGRSRRCVPGQQRDWQPIGWIISLYQADNRKKSGFAGDC